MHNVYEVSTFLHSVIVLTNEKKKNQNKSKQKPNKQNTT